MFLEKLKHWFYSLFSFESKQTHNTNDIEEKFIERVNDS